MFNQNKIGDYIMKITKILFITIIVMVVMACGGFNNPLLSESGGSEQGSGGSEQG